MVLRKLATVAMAVSLSMGMAGCPKLFQGSASHKVTAAQHSFKSAVQAFQDAEIAEYQKGFVPLEYHVKIQMGIKKVALGGVDIDNSLIAGLSGAGLKAKLDALYQLVDSLNTDGLVGVSNPTSKAALEVALDAIKAIVDNALTQVS